MRSWPKAPQRNLDTYITNVSIIFFNISDVVIFKIYDRTIVDTTLSSVKRWLGAYVFYAQINKYNF